MARTKTGIVMYANEKEWEDTILYSFKLRDDDTFYSCGETPHGVEKDDEIEFEYRKKGTKYYVEDDTIDVLGQAKPAAKKAAPRGGKSGGWKGKGGGGSGGGAAAMSKEDWERKDGQIRYAGALNTAVALANLEQAAGKLPVKASSKAETYADLILAYVMKRADDIWLAISEAPDRLKDATPSFKDLEQPEDLEQEEEKKPARRRKAKPKVVEEPEDEEDDDDFDDD